MSGMNSTLKQYMTPAQRAKLGDHPTWHRNMIDLFGVARAGKTARDRANGNGLVKRKEAPVPVTKKKSK